MLIVFWSANSIKAGRRSFGIVKSQRTNHLNKADSRRIIIRGRQYLADIDGSSRKLYARCKLLYWPVTIPASTALRVASHAAARLLRPGPNSLLNCCSLTQPPHRNLWDQHLLCCQPCIAAHHRIPSQPALCFQPKTCLDLHTD